MKRRDLMEVIEAVDAAIEQVLAHWAKGDLAGAVRELEAVRNEHVTPAIEWWNSDEA